MYSNNSFLLDETDMKYDDDLWVQPVVVLDDRATAS